MSLKIRLRQQGKKNQIVYRLVLSESRSPRDGKYIEALGWYNPLATEPSKAINVQADRVLHWLNLGAILTEKAQMLVKRGAPSVMEAYQKKLIEAKKKACEKRKALRKKEKAAA